MGDWVRAFFLGISISISIGIGSATLGLAACGPPAGPADPNYPTSGLRYFAVVNCTPEFESKVWTALHHLESLMDQGDDWLRCAQDASREVRPLVTRQEFTAVGPYVPCNGTTLKDPDTAFANPQAEFGRALYYLTRTFTTDQRGTITIRCTSDTSTTASNPSRFGPGTKEPFQVFINAAPQLQRPSHQPLTDSLPDQGQTFDYSAIEPTYPVEELAGIIAHEIMHSHGYEHGDEQNQCKYTSYDCAGSQAGQSCRANSLLEIFEACISETLELGAQRCYGNVYPFNYGSAARITPVVESGSRCSWYAVSSPRDVRGIVRTQIEPETNRPGIEHASAAAASAMACRQLCVADAGCFSFTYADGTCSLKSGVPLPVYAPGMSSGLVRVDGSGALSFNEGELYPNTDLPGGTFSMIAGAAPKSCIAPCLADTRCIAFTHHAGQCNLKSVLPASEVPLAEATTAYVRKGPRPPRVEYNVSRTGTILGTFTDALHLCIRACSSDASCIGATWIPGGCTRFTAALGIPTSAVGAVSFVKTPP